MSRQIPPKDRRAITDEVARLGARSVLEFGPGESTSIFLAAGVQHITTCEYADEWYKKAFRDYADEPRVEVRRFANEAPATVVGPPLGEFALAFVDAPVGDKRRVRLEGQEGCARLNTTLLALQHAPVVLLHDAHRPGEQATLDRIREAGHTVTYLSRGVRSDTGKGVARIERCTT